MISVRYTPELHNRLREGQVPDPAGPSTATLHGYNPKLTTNGLFRGGSGSMPPGVGLHHGTTSFAP